MGTANKPEWSWGQFFGWGTAAAIGTGGAAAAIAFLTGDPTSGVFTYTIVINGLGNALGGAVGGSGGYGLSHRLDDPFGQSQQFKRSFLFGLVFTLLIYSLLSFPSIGFLKANPNLQLPYGIIVAFLSGLIAAGLKGVLNNLKAEDRTYS